MQYTKQHQYSNSIFLKILTELCHHRKGAEPQIRFGLREN